MKYCPKCNKKYPDSDGFCNADGSMLAPVPTEPRRSGNGKKWVYTAVSVAFLILLGVNMIPFGLKWAASNCTVDLVGISIKGSTNIYKDFQEIIDIFRTGEVPKNNDDINLILRIRNKNLFSLSIEQVNVRLYINNKQAATGNLPSGKKMKMEARTKTELKLPLDISLRAIPTIIMDREVRCKAEGNVVVNTFVGTVDYPISIDSVHLPIKM